MQVLDKGYIELIGIMGKDEDIAKSARVSFISNNGKTYTKDDDTKLIKYLYENGHMSPFEMVTYRFEIKAPLFVARQWFRHRAGSFNERSGRYSIMEDEFYYPSTFHSQDKTNKQGRGEALENSEEVGMLYGNAMERIYNIYKSLLHEGVCKEQARLVLPLSIYTLYVWQTNLRNLFNFLNQRAHPHAQYEIRQYAETIEKFVEHNNPIAYKVWKENKK